MNPIRPYGVNAYNTYNPNNNSKPPKSVDTDKASQMNSVQLNLSKAGQSQLQAQQVRTVPEVTEDQTDISQSRPSNKTTYNQFAQSNQSGNTGLYSGQNFDISL